MTFDCIVYTDKGKIRSENQDNFYVKKTYLKESDSLSKKLVLKSPCYLGVFDGMGGHSRGKEASYICSKGLYFYTNILKKKSIGGYIKFANTQINKIKEKFNCECGSTCVVAYIDKDGIIDFANVGDSRIYGFDGVSLKQLSVDDTEAQMLINEGIYTKERAMQSSKRHVLIQHLGMGSEYIIESHRRKVDSKEYKAFLMCTDGLTDMLSDEEIEDILKKNDFEKASELLFETALKKGGKDNITFILSGNFKGW